MAIRKKRQTNLLKDTTTGTVNISHGGSSRPQNTGFFGSSFTNTGSSSRKRRRRRLHARAQQAAQAIAEAEAIAQAERQAQEHAQSLAKAQHEREQRVKAEATARAQTEAAARAQAEKEQAYRYTINSLTESFRTESRDIARHFTAKFASLSESIAQEIGFIDSQQVPHTAQQALDLILQEKVQINYLIAMKSVDRDALNNALTASGTGVGNPDPSQYKHFLEAHSNGDANLSHQFHRRWIDAYTHTQESQLLSQAISLLEERSTQLSTQHAELSHTFRSARETEESVSTKHVNTLWNAVAPPALSATTAGIETAQTKTAHLAKEYFFRIASKALTRNAGLALAAYAPILGDAERPSPVVGTPLSQLNLPETLDLAYVASVGGAIDVPHRLVESTDGERSLAQWTATDGIKLGTKVRVRTFTYNAQNNTYEFIRDGESTPSLIWTPIARPADSSTVSPLRPPALPADPGTTVAPVAPELETYPAIDRNDPDDYILVSPIDSGLPDTYLLFKDPRSIPGVASGYGATVDANWLKNSAKSQGAPIPSSIAEQLRGQKFNSFDGLREAIWLAASKDPELSRHFSFINNREVLKKRAPYALPEDRIGSRVKLEIHHKHWISNGGAVYDLDNLTIMTPKEHIQTHRKIRT
ncbi:S-type pyocin domain-containing protein [Pseudomonas alliivorans]|nr:S-type pyocin domain-containing protein [Pseudomonas alliivorans]MEE4711338.1 S-type pyocin domain-containing protein [Pseudomonas alliivorans]MEE4727169.1 S-type pyocin domain-containing protein [Pseudomonas alliivorans]MEE4768903.1 S-type pyocin domain-containing protein [Pseudomonas alliivorans]